MVKFLDYFGNIREGIIVGRDTIRDHVWIRVEDNLFPGATKRYCALLKKWYDLDVMPDFRQYDAWVPRERVIG